MEFNEEYNTKFKVFDRLANKIIWNEPTPLNCRELARRAIELAEMIEKKLEKDE